jgi:hypothetical protein
MINAFDIACAQHWLILPEALEKILAIANRDFDADVLVRARADWENRKALATSSAARRSTARARSRSVRTVSRWCQWSARSCAIRT